jgi:hypothetical protein
MNKRCALLAADAVHMQWEHGLWLHLLHAVGSFGAGQCHHQYQRPSLWLTCCGRDWQGPHCLCCGQVLHAVHCVCHGQVLHGAHGEVPRGQPP